jgi:predicted DNA-binding protein with PD1-like motif
MKLHALRMVPGEDLRQTLDNVASERGISAGFIVSATGSLSRACIRLAGARTGTVMGGPLEIIALSGTLSRDGCHLHVAAADARGHMLGGHVMDGCVIHTTAEIVIGESTELSFTREHDAATGYRELVIKPKQD